MSVTKCKVCGNFLEPTDVALETEICGYCSGRISEEVQQCFDGSPCSESHRNCNKCQWLR